MKGDMKGDIEGDNTPYMPGSVTTAGPAATVGVTATDHGFMQRALELAARGLFDTDPNPAVGCVIVQRGQIVGEGWTAPAGGPHAEIRALAAAGEQARGADVFVTLEPCCHRGRTGPCTAALIEAGVARVVYAIDDPNPAVGGAGARALATAGIGVATGLGAHEAQRLNEGFFSRMRRGRPFVRVKLAASLDGRTALRNGVSQWITGPQSRADVHYWRARSSAVLSSAATVLADDALLTARPENPPGDVHQPLRVVLDSRNRLRAGARLFTAESPVLVLGLERANAARELPGHAQWCGVAADAGGRCDLHAVVALLGEREINDVWVEAGSRLAGALLETGLIDELIVYTAPVVLGEDAPGMFAVSGLTRMEQRHEFALESVARFGGDLRVAYRPSTVPDPANSPG